MVAPKRKLGRPEDTAGKINAGILLDADTDFLDAFDPDSPRNAPPRVVLDSPNRVENPTEARAPDRKLVVAPVPRDEAQREGEELPPARKGKKTGPEPAHRENAKKKLRPPRVDIGYRPELDAAASKLRKEAITQSAEPSLNRTDVVSAAVCAVARALGSVNYSRVQPRGHYGTASARQLHEELEEAYVVALGEHYIDQYRHRISDRALRTCYEIYKQRMEGSDTHEMPRPKV